MVQGEGYGNQGAWSSVEKDQDAKRVGFMSLQQKCQKTVQQLHQSNASAAADTKNSKPYGVWGPQLRNADFFKKLHNY